MIKKYNEYINEKFSDKLSGFDAEELKQQFLSDKISFDKYYSLLKQYKLQLPSFNEITMYYKQNKINIIYYVDYCILKKYEIPASILDKLKTHLINEYKNDNTHIIDVGFGELIRKLNHYKLSLNKSDILNIFEYKFNYGKFDFSNIIDYNNQYNLKLTDDEIFNIIGFAKSFDNANDFIEYIFDNFDKKINNDIISYNNKQTNLIIINRYNEVDNIKLDYDIYKILKIYFKLNEYNIEILLNDVIQKYYNFNTHFNVSYTFK